MRKAAGVMALAVVVSSSACQGHPLGPHHGEILLQQLAFTPSEIRGAESLVLVGHTLEMPGTDEHPVLIRTSGGKAFVSSLRGISAPDLGMTVRSYWRSFSHEEMTALIHSAGERAFMGFKEADADRGVDEKGRVLVSDATIEQMKAYVQDLGITIRMDYDGAPGIAANVPAKLSLTAHLRSHPNIDYLEPIFPGERLAAGARVPANLVVAAITPDRMADAGISIGPGTVVTAEYRQPDASLLTATATVRD